MAIRLQLQVLEKGSLQLNYRHATFRVTGYGCLDHHSLSQASPGFVKQVIMRAPTGVKSARSQEPQRAPASIAHTLLYFYSGGSAVTSVLIVNAGVVVAFSGLKPVAKQNG